MLLKIPHKCPPSFSTLEIIEKTSPEVQQCPKYLRVPTQKDENRMEHVYGGLHPAVDLNILVKSSRIVDHTVQVGQFAIYSCFLNDFIRICPQCFLFFLL